MAKRGKKVLCACGEVIPPERLKALNVFPGQAVRCVLCQAKLEKSGKALRTQLPADRSGVVATNRAELADMQTTLGAFPER